MSNVLKSSQLINSIKRKGMIPSDQRTFDDTDFLNMLNEEMQYFAVPHLLSTHEEYLVDFLDVDASTITNGKIRIPYRAVGNKLRDLSYVDSNDHVIELSRVQLEDISEYSRSYTVTYPEVFYVQGSDIVILDQIPQDGKFRLHYYLRPSKLVKDEEVAVISAINTTTGEITLSNFPSTFSTLSFIDLVESRTPNKIYDYDISVTSTNSTLKTVTIDPDEIPEGLMVGDYMSVCGESMVPQLPTELHPILAQRVVVSALEALGDEQGIRVAQSRLEMMEKATLSILDDRVEGAPQKIVNRGGLLRNQIAGSRSLRQSGKL
jgi:hypothetical protein